MLNHHAYTSTLQKYNQTVANIDKDKKVVTLASGATIQYNSLLCTLPLDITLRWLGKPEWADGLQHSSSHIIGIGIRGNCPHGTKCWLYYPEDNCPFYRCAHAIVAMRPWCTEHSFCLTSASIRVQGAFSHITGLIRLIVKSVA